MPFILQITMKDNGKSKSGLQGSDYMDKAFLLPLT